MRLLRDVGRQRAERVDEHRHTGCCSDTSTWPGAFRVDVEPGGLHHAAARAPRGAAGRRTRRAAVDELAVLVRGSARRGSRRSLRRRRPCRRTSPASRCRRRTACRRRARRSSSARSRAARGVNASAPSTPKPPALLTAATTSRQCEKAKIGNSMSSRSQIGVRISRSCLRLRVYGARSETRRRSRASGRIPPPSTPRPRGLTSRSTMPDAIIERDGPTMVITMNRPQRYNALSTAMLVRMYDAMVEADEDPEIRCVILTGAGGNFSSGADLRAMAATPVTPTPRSTCRRAWPPIPTSPTRASCALYRPSKPFIAAVEGVAIAGGTEILQQTDIRIAGRVGALRRERGALVALPDGRLRGAPAAADPLHARGRDPAHRQAPHGRGSGRIGLDRPRRSRRPGAGEGQGDRGDDRARTGRSRWKRCCERCARPTA